MDKDYINIKVKVEDIQQRLGKIINSDNAPLIAKIIIDNLLLTEKGIEQLYNSFSGIAPGTPFSPGDVVMVHHHSLPTWRMDKERCKQIMEGDYIRAIIEGIDLRKGLSILVRFDYYKDGVEELETDTTWAREEDVKMADSGIIDFNNGKD